MSRYLLIDDDHVINIIHTEVIHRVDAAAAIEIMKSGVDALNYLVAIDENQKPDVIFLDINMPEMGGFEFVDKLVAERANILNGIRVVLLSSTVNPDDMKKSESYKEIETFTSKPLTQKYLRDVLKVG